MNILVCDCGTSACRASVVDAENGRRLFDRTSSLPSQVLTNDGADVDLDRLWQIVCALLRETAGAFGGAIDVVGVSTFFGYAFLDGALQSIGPASSWMDNRAEPEARRLALRLGDGGPANRTGRRLTGELLIPKLVHMAATQPQRFARLHRVVGIKDEIVRRLTGELGTDLAHADYSGGFSPYSRAFLAEVWEAAGMDSDLLPSPVSASDRAGTVTADAALHTGLRSGTPVIRGTSDGSAAMYGCGVMIPGVAAFVSGTTDVLMRHVAAGQLPAETIDAALTVNSCMIGRGILAGGAMGFSGGAASWLAAITGSRLAALEAEAHSVPAGAEGLLMIPSLTGERSPFWNPASHGAWIGIRAAHSAGHLFRSCLEGSAVRAAILLERLNAAGLTTSSLRVGGGGSRSALWDQIRADATGLPVAASEDFEATTRGTALLCLPLLLDKEMTEMELAVASERWMAPLQTFSPDPELYEIYRSARRRYERVVSARLEER